LKKTISVGELVEEFLSIIPQEGQVKIERDCETLMWEVTDSRFSACEEELIFALVGYINSYRNSRESK